MMRSLKNILVVGTGVALILGGVPIFFLPVPLGLIMIGTGLFLIVRTSPRARLYRIQLRHRHPDFFRKLDASVARIGNWFRREKEIVRGQRRR